MYSSIGNQYLCASAVETLALGTRQLANSLPIWEERYPQPQATTGKELFFSAESFGVGARLQCCLVI